MITGIEFSIIQIRSGSFFLFLFQFSLDIRSIFRFRVRIAQEIFSLRKKKERKSRERKIHLPRTLGTLFRVMGLTNGIFVHFAGNSLVRATRQKFVCPYDNWTPVSF